ncbi:recombinase family protein [Hymenobacter cellulosilyticus]|uniref:recombinase family protein n=1 Tax=Hymenobacter cellulosilyticus TaxID=2932248 RepID=UPI0035CAE7F0
MIFGYARVSTADLQLPLQADALQGHSCAEVAQEKVSSMKVRPALQHLLTRLPLVLNVGVFSYPRR